MNILLVELWGIGDAVMMTSIIGAIKRKYPNSSISVLGQTHLFDLLMWDLRVDHIYTFQFPWTKKKGKYNIFKWDWKGLFRTIKHMRERKYDRMYDARGDIRNIFLSLFFRIKKRVFFLKRFRQHRVQTWKDLVEKDGIITTTSDKPELILKQEEIDDAKRILNNMRSSVVIHAGAGSKNRMWGMENFKIISCILKSNNIFIKDPDHNVGIELPLRGLMAVLSQARLLICNDSGPMHIASAFNTRVCAIFGPTDPVVFAPYGQEHNIVIKEGMDCRPCLDKCIHPEPYCINLVKVQDVMNHLKGEIIEKIL